MYQFNEAVEVFCCYLVEMLVFKDNHDVAFEAWIAGIVTSSLMDETYCIVALIEVVDISIQDLDEQLNGHGSVHACVCYT